MNNYSDIIIREKIIKQFFSKFKQHNIEIVIVTYNRLPYLQKCIWSLIASSYIPIKIIVIDDQSTDKKTVKWLNGMKKRRLIEKIISSKLKLGTANAFNFAIDNEVKGKWFIFANDDMWFHRGWDVAAIDLLMKYDNCGAVNLYDYTALKIGKNSRKVDEQALIVNTTGLGSVMFYKPLWDKTNGFKLPTTQVMGFFASNFCKVFQSVKIRRNRLYQTIPPYVIHMDNVTCKLNERKFEEISGYIEYRKKEKNK